MHCLLFIFDRLVMQSHGIRTRECHRKNLFEGADLVAEIVDGLLHLGRNHEPLTHVDYTSAAFSLARRVSLSKSISRVSSRSFPDNKHHNQDRLWKAFMREVLQCRDKLCRRNILKTTIHTRPRPCLDQCPAPAFCSAEVACACKDRSRACAAQRGSLDNVGSVLEPPDTSPRWNRLPGPARGCIKRP